MFGLSGGWAMWRALRVIGLFFLGWSTETHAESLYLTTLAPIPGVDYGSSYSGYTFIAPYFARVQTKVSVSILGGASKSDSSPPGPPTLTITVNPLPKTRAYLYLVRNAFFSDTINVGVSSDGMLSSSDSSSAQQVTAILNEIASTAALFHAESVTGEKATPPQNDHDKCFNDLANYVKSGPFYANFPPFVNISRGGYSWIRSDISAAGDANPVKLRVSVTPLIPSQGQIEIEDAQPGLVAFFPVPAIVQVACVVGSHTIPVVAPQTVNLYTESHFLDPQRDFLTGPQDTFTFSEGFITGHKYSDQSPAKTIVDTVTGPIKSIMPSVTVTQSVAVSPTGKTTTTSTQTGPPKGP